MIGSGVPRPGGALVEIAGRTHRKNGSKSRGPRFGCQENRHRPYRRLHEGECIMDELNGKLIACQILITGLIARVANEQRDPLRFLTDFRDEIKAVVNGVNITGMESTDRVRAVAQKTVDELFSLMKPPSSD
jgi:hypothetical protein